MQRDKDGAVFGAVTLAVPQSVEWQIEGGVKKMEGHSLRDFVTALASASEGREAVLWVNFVVSL